MKWIDVRDNIPPPHRLVIANTRDGWLPAKHTGKRWMQVSLPSGLRLCETFYPVTHWFEVERPVTDNVKGDRT